MRGIRYVGLPTTLLAQVDSSLGGKTGVNLLAGKNLIGAFHHPLAVFSDIDTLATLPAAELRAGLQEAIKSAIIRDAKLFRYMEQSIESILQSNPAALARVVAASVRVKAEVVSQDEKESGLRMVLNFGHTIGHAIEAATHYRKLLHGEAIAWGSIAALHVSLARQHITHDEFARMANLILRYGPIPPFKIAATPQASAARLIALTSADKKKRSGRRAFVLASAIGRTQVAYDVTDAELLAATQAMLKGMRSHAQ
jgi:3-dehydroquinate synthase